MYAFIESITRTATTEADCNRNNHENINVLCISNYTLLFQALTALCLVCWNVANYHNSIHSFEYSARCCRHRLGGLWKRQNLQFCVQVFSADIGFHKLIRKEHRLGVIYCVLVKANF